MQEAEVVGVSSSTQEAEEGEKYQVVTQETEVDGEDGSGIHSEQVVTQEEELFVEDNVSFVPPPISISMVTNECDSVDSIDSETASVEDYIKSLGRIGGPIRLPPIIDVAPKVCYFHCELFV